MVGEIEKGRGGEHGKQPSREDQKAMRQHTLTADVKTSCVIINSDNSPTRH